MVTSADRGPAPPSPSGMKAVALDAFGTVVRIADPRKPFRRLLQIGEAAGRPILPSDPATIMSMGGGLSEAAARLGIGLTPTQRRELEADVVAEAASVIPFSETFEVLHELRGTGKRLVLVSNLSEPYGDRLKEIIGNRVDAYVLSYEVGAVKPDPAIYAAAISHAACSPVEVLFVGDTPLADVEGPTASGMQAKLIDRRGRHPRIPSFSSLSALLASS